MFDSVIDECVQATSSRARLRHPPSMSSAGITRLNLSPFRLLDSGDQAFVTMTSHCDRDRTAFRIAQRYAT